MSHLLNKLFGRDESESQSQTQSENEIRSSSVTGSQNQDSRTTHTSTGGQVTTEGTVVQRDGVNIKSTISSDASSTVSLANQQKLNELVTKLGSLLILFNYSLYIFF